MTFASLQTYLARLSNAEQADARVWLDNEGRVQGRYFNSTLTSAFQPIRTLDSNSVIGFEGFARSYSDSDQGLSLWKLLDHAADDNESIELDRLCRMLHAINFYRQPQPTADASLFLSVHGRLLAAVDGNHGVAFLRILKALDLPQEKIVLQLPAITPHQGWLLNYVADNYRRNGFRFAVNAKDATSALALLERVRPEAIKVDAREIQDDDTPLKLLLDSAQHGVRIIFKRVENIHTLETLRRLGSLSGQAIHAQGFLLDKPRASLDFFNAATTDSGGRTVDRLSDQVWHTA